MIDKSIVKGVLIDIDNTLLDFNESAKLAMQMSFDKFGLPFTDVVHPTFIRINDGLWLQIEKGTLTRERLHATRWNLILKELGIDFDGTVVEKDFLENLNVCAVPVEGAMEVLEYLSKKYYLCVASNAPQIQSRQRMKISGIDKLIKQAFISQEMGVNKPAKEFFEKCFERAPQLKPEETVMIGDSLTADIAGGKAYGLQTVWYNFYGASSRPDIVDAEVKKMAEIKNIL